MGLNHPMKNDLCDFPRGARNLLTDVPGVRVGHYTLDDGDIHTGVTAILPARDSLFESKMVAAAHVANGFGKSVGLVQIGELGNIETPILLTNTLSVGTVSTALSRYMVEKHPKIGRETGTVNPAVLECNDGHLSDIRAFAVREEHALAAMDAAAEDFAEGAVGAGRGMMCFGLKGGIGSASRQVTLDGEVFALGCLVLANFGSLPNLRIFGKPVGRTLAKREQGPPEKGSIIVILATDLPLSSRQLGRLCKRAEVGIARTGGYIGGDSGEIVLGFTTANRQPHEPAAQILGARLVAETALDSLFRAVASATEEAVLSALVHAETLEGRDGNVAQSLCGALGGAYDAVFSQ